jgi:glycine cleavage system H protein
MNYPEGLKYSVEHEWVRVTEDKSEDGKTIVAVGITDFAQSELGELVYVEVDTVGEEIAKDEVFGAVEAVKTTSELFMPISGTVIEFNEQLDETKGDNPTLLNEDPYGEGWIVKISLSNEAELEELMNSEAYQESLA